MIENDLVRFDILCTSANYIRWPTANLYLSAPPDFKPLGYIENTTILSPREGLAGDVR